MKHATCTTFRTSRRAPDSRKLAIDKVGIKAIRHRYASRALGRRAAHHRRVQHVRLPAAPFQGHPHVALRGDPRRHEREITVETFQVMLREMVERLEAEEGHIEMSFPYFIEKKAPVSGVKSLMDYEVTFQGESKKGKQSFTMKVVVPVTSLCPCSKRISERGAHNQRSHVDGHRPHQRLRLDRGDRRPGREAGLERALRPAQAPGREARHRARL